MTFDQQSAAAEVTSMEAAEQVEELSHVKHMNDSDCDFNC